MIIIRVLATALAFTAFTGLHVEQAQAAPKDTDRRGCVGFKESNRVHFDTRRGQVERDWEVQGLGRPGTAEILGAFGFLSGVTIYPLCGLPFPTNYAAAHYTHSRLDAVVTQTFMFNGVYESTPDDVVYQ